MTNQIPMNLNLNKNVQGGIEVTHRMIPHGERSHHCPHTHLKLKISFENMRTEIFEKCMTCSSKRIS